MSAEAKDLATELLKAKFVAVRVLRELMENASVPAGDRIQAAAIVLETQEEKECWE